MENKDNENQTALEKVVPEKRSSKIFRNIKKRVLINRTNTIILVAILIAIFILINSAMKYFDFTPIDCTTSKDYSLTDESKERVKGINKDVNVYFFYWEKSDKDYELAKQYNKANSKINVEIIDANEKVDLSKKYKIQEDVPTIIVECDDNSRTLYQYDLVNYNYETYAQVDIAEQKITSAILNVTSEKTPKAYFLTGYTEFDLNTNLTTFAQYLGNEVLTYEALNILNKQKVPDDCDTLVIMTPNKDFDDLTTKAILDYIKKGGNILWFNGIYDKDNNFKNVNKILSQYGVNKFEKGIIYETDNDKIFGYDTCFAPDIQESSILKDVKLSAQTVFFYATKININEDSLEDLKVEKTDLLLASEKSFFTTNLTVASDGKDDKQGSFVVGAQLVKTVKEAEKSKDNSDEDKEAITSSLIIYGNDLFISDSQVQISEGYTAPIISLFNNADVALNSIAYLTNNDQDITIRKSFSDSQTTFTPTNAEKSRILTLIFMFPILIILAGIIIWIIRRRRT